MCGIAGKPIVRPPMFAATAEAAKSAPSSNTEEPEDPEAAKHGLSKHFPVTSIETFEKLSDTELYEIFHQGVADIPSALPNQLGAFLIAVMTCKDVSVHVTMQYNLKPEMPYLTSDLEQP